MLLGVSLLMRCLRASVGTCPGSSPATNITPCQLPCNILNATFMPVHLVRGSMVSNKEHLQLSRTQQHRLVCTIQGCSAGQNTHKVGAAGQHHPAVLGPAAGPASAERGARRTHRPGQGPPHGEAHAGKMSISAWHRHTKLGLAATQYLDPSEM